jgi:hypothetical protein
MSGDVVERERGGASRDSRNIHIFSTKWVLNHLLDDLLPSYHVPIFLRVLNRVHQTFCT